jgi:peptidoglycan/xylan/chitin deacetylase (PgdA/CDA1 family)
MPVPGGCNHPCSQKSDRPLIFTYFFVGLCMAYWAKTPRWLKKCFPKELIWDMPADTEPTIYLTFDDGPHPIATPYVLALLEAHRATATFFCIGKNVVLYPDIYQQAIEKGHTVGNHTHNHLNGWKTDNHTYLKNILKAKQHINSLSFRPPYGRIKLSQAKKLYKANDAWRIYMWDILSCDYDMTLTPEQCVRNVLDHIEPGAIIVFHDSEKAWPRMKYALPKVLDYCKEQNWKVKCLPKH